jgi:hypothetical protein
MRAITTRGTGREIGRALGEEARQAVHERVFESRAYADLRRWRGSERLAAIMAATRRACPAFVEEIAGIADGVGAPLDDIFLWNCRGDLPPPGSDPEGCTSIMVPAHEDHAALIAHNEDGGANLAGSGFMARVEPEGGLGYDTYCYPGMLPGHSFAMNDAGLVQTINNISPRDLTTGIARHVVCRAILACRNLDEALGWLRRGDRASGFHHNLGAAAEARLISVEAPASGCALRPVTAPRAHANHLVFSEFADLPQTVSPSTAARQSRAEALLPEADDPLTILFDRANERLPVLCRGEAANGQAYTLATALFRLDPSGVRLEVFHGPSREPVFTARTELASVS